MNSAPAVSDPRGGRARSVEVGALAAARLALARDLSSLFAARRSWCSRWRSSRLVTMLFPLSISPELSRLRQRGAGCAVGGGVAILAAGARVPVPRRRAGRHARAVRAVGPVAHVAAVREDRAHWLLTGLPLALMAPHRRAGARVRRRARCRASSRAVALGSVDAEPDRRDRRGAHARHHAAAACCCRC